VRICTPQPYMQERAADSFEVQWYAMNCCDRLRS
jgi:hypothetical protein